MFKFLFKKKNKDALIGKTITKYSGDNYKIVAEYKYSGTKRYVLLNAKYNDVCTRSESDLNDKTMWTFKRSNKPGWF